MLVSYASYNLYPSDQIDENSTWPGIETACLSIEYSSDAVGSLFNSGRWNELNRCAFLTVKYNNSENLVLQHLPVKEKIKKPYKNSRLEEITRMSIGVIIDTLTSVDIVEISKCGGVFLEVFEGFFCQSLEYIPTEFVTDMFEKRHVFKS